MLWETIKKYRIYLAALAAVILIGICWGGIYAIAGSKQSLLGILSILGNLASAVIAFLAASILFSSEESERFEGQLRRIIQESTGNPTTLDQVPWANFIGNAEEIDFVVQGWDRWGDQQSIAAALTEFFGRKGKFRLYVCNPDSAGASHARALLAERLSRSPGDVGVEIKGTQRTINDIRERIPLADRGPPVEVYETDSFNWYFAAFFRGRKLTGGTRVRDVVVFSVYAHTKRRPWDMPAQVVYPDTQSNDFREWFEAELKHLRDGVPKPSKYVGTVQKNETGLLT